MRKIFRWTATALAMVFVWALIMAAAILTGVLGSASASTTGTIYQQWKFKTGDICINDHGWTRWDFTATAKQWDASTDISIIRSNGCAGYPVSQIINVTAYNDPNERACAKTGSMDIDGDGNVLDWVQMTTKQGVVSMGYAPEKMTIHMNMASNIFSLCHATAAQRAHVAAHEVGHAIGQSHNTINSVMNYWSLQAPTYYDIKYVTVRY